MSNRTISRVGSFLILLALVGVLSTGCTTLQKASRLADDLPGYIEVVKSAYNSAKTFYQDRAVDFREKCALGIYGPSFCKAGRELDVKVRKFDSKAQDVGATADYYSGRLGDYNGAVKEQAKIIEAAILAASEDGASGGSP